MLQISNRKIFSGTRASERLSNNFKSVSRDKDPTWSNRFIKDHYDLVYDADPYSISHRFNKKNKKLKEEVKNQSVQSATKKYQYSPQKARQIPKTSQTQRTDSKGMNPQKYISSFKDYEKAVRNGQETAPSTHKKDRYPDSSRKITIKQFHHQQQPFYNDQQPLQIQQNCQEENKLAKVNMMGLSHFQFENTIKGKLLMKSNHHIDFSKNKTNKINNIIQKWYDYSKDIQKQDIILEKQRYRTLQKIHPFKSYSSHKLFHKDKRFDHDNGCGHGGFLDKFYQITKPEIYQFNHQTANKKNVDYYTMTARPELRKKLGNNLQYEDIHSYKTLGRLNNKRPIMSMSNSERKLVFTRQVISPKRGCFR